MKGLSSELIGLTEKIADQSLKGKNLEVLGLEIPSTLEEVGIVGAVSSIAKILISLRDVAFTKAFQEFYGELSELTPEQKIKFYEKYSNKKIQEFGEQAVLMLNKIEAPIAANMMGRAHFLLVANEIDEDTYYNYCFVIKNINNYLLTKIKEVFSIKRANDKYQGGVYSMLYSLALMVEVPKEHLYTGHQQSTEYMQSQFGGKFYRDIIQKVIEDS